MQDITEKTQYKFELMFDTVKFNHFFSLLIIFSKNIKVSGPNLRED